MKQEKRTPALCAEAGGIRSRKSREQTQTSDFSPSAQWSAAGWGNPAFRRCVAKLHALGPRVLGELLLEVEAGANLTDRLAVYAALAPDMLAATGGDRLPPRPIHRVAA